MCFFLPETNFTLLKQCLMKMQKFLARKRVFFNLPESYHADSCSEKNPLMFLWIKEGLGRLNCTPPGSLKKGSSIWYSLLHIFSLRITAETVLVFAFGDFREMPGLDPPYWAFHKSCCKKDIAKRMLLSEWSNFILFIYFCYYSQMLPQEVETRSQELTV